MPPTTNPNEHNSPSKKSLRDSPCARIRPARGKNPSSKHSALRRRRQRHPRKMPGQKTKTTPRPTFDQAPKNPKTTPSATQKNDPYVDNKFHYRTADKPRQQPRLLPLQPRTKEIYIATLRLFKAKLTETLHCDTNISSKFASIEKNYLPQKELPIWLKLLESI